MENKELNFKGLRLNGFFMIFIILILLAGAAFISIYLRSFQWMGPVIAVIAIFLCVGFMMLEPNEARAMVFFGKYKGTFYNTGLWWVNPFMVRKKVSLRARNLNAEPIKVNDKRGNPILIGLVLVWKVNNVYKALFEIDSQTMANTQTANIMNALEGFVSVQSDAALRQVAGQYAYDDMNEEDTITLRSGGEEINEQLVAKLNERLAMAGIDVVEARINYLAYAPEIAATMLRRQQADAIISAREKIVEGAVTMVKMALDKLCQEDIVELDEDKKAAMVSNLLVVLCADEAASPVINTGSLYQ